MLKIIFSFIIAILLFDSFLLGAEVEKKIPILCYHRFGAEVTDSVTIKTSAFAKQLAWLKESGYTVIPLDSAVKYLKGEIKTIPDKSVVITADDGHKSVYSDMAPLVKLYRIPVTLFIYPSAISHTNYTMTWDQLRNLEATKFFRVESHMYWHPNFKVEKKRLSADEYSKFVDKQLAGSKHVIEEKMDHEVKYLAWAFGVYDDELEAKAAQSGYSAAFTIERRHAALSDAIMALPRYMIVSVYDIKTFEKIMSGDAE
ncbi:MAG: polysaccharide deacetylase family protein [Thermoleophilia bacterium]|nr:polysaccharide deacetylase family protein [Thermoleophilia bacterium]